MKTFKYRWQLGALATGMLALAACDRTTAPKPAAPVRFKLAALSGTPVTASSSAGSSLDVSSIQLVIGRAALGDGVEFGCRDCQGNFEDAQMAPLLVNLPSEGGSVDVVTEQVTAGRYGQAELSLEVPSSATLAGMAGAPAGTTMRIGGRFNGVLFQLDFAIRGSFRGSLNPPLDVTAAASTTTATVVIRLPVRAWFEANGVVLDPAVAANRALIEANVRASFAAVEAESSPAER